MKKLIFIFLLISIFSLTACSNKDCMIVENTNVNNTEEVTEGISGDNNRGLLDKLASMATADDEFRYYCKFFISDSLHIDTMIGFDSGYPDSYYFMSDGTYFWDAGDYKDPMNRVCATAGVWKINIDENETGYYNGELVLNEKYQLYISGDEIGKVSQIGGNDDVDGLIGDKVLREVDEVTTHSIKFIGVSNVSLELFSAKSPAYEYYLDERLMHSNASPLKNLIEENEMVEGLDLPYLIKLMKEN